MLGGESICLTTRPNPQETDLKRTPVFINSQGRSIRAFGLWLQP